MNIFALYSTPQESARAHCDQHLHKMILESAQIISTALHLNNYYVPWAYYSTHQKHPCVQWAAESIGNMFWLIDLATELETIRQELDCPRHMSSDIIKHAEDFLSEEVITYNLDDTASIRPLAMPVHIKMQPKLTVEEKYQMYYKWKNQQWIANNKPKMTWHNRPVPNFMLTAANNNFSAPQ